MVLKPTDLAAGDLELPVDTAQIQSQIISPSIEELYGATSAGVHLSSTSVLEVSSYQSILPSPSDLKAFRDIDESFPERLLRLVEGEVSHRQQIERDQMEITRTQIDTIAQDARQGRSENRLGQVFALTIAIAFLIGGVTVTLMDYPDVGIKLMGGTLASLVIALAIGRVTMPKNDTSEDDD